MKLSMYTCHARDVFPPDFAAALRRYRDLGVQGGVFLQSELKKIPFHRYCDYLEDAGLSLDGFVSQCNVASFDENTRIDQMALLKGQIDHAAKRGMPLVMIAPAVEEAATTEERLIMREHMVESYNAIIDYARGSGIRITVENFSLPTRADSFTEDLRYLFDNVPELGFVLDTGNFYCVHEDVLDAYEKLGDRLVQIHCKDWIHDENGWLKREGLPMINGVTLGEGLMPLAQVLERAKVDHPDVVMMLEDNSNNLTLEGLDRSVEFLKQFMEGGN